MMSVGKLCCRRLADVLGGQFFGVPLLHFTGDRVPNFTKVVLADTSTIVEKSFQSLQRLEFLQLRLIHGMSRAINLGIGGEIVNVGVKFGEIDSRIGITILHVEVG